VLPSLRPAIVAGAALAFARAVGEFGSVVLISGGDIVFVRADAALAFAAA